MNNSNRILKEKKERALKLNYRIIPATETHVFSIYKLYKEVGIQTQKDVFEFDKLGGIFEIPTLQQISNMLLDPNKLILVAVDNVNGQVIGYVSLITGVKKTFESIKYFESLKNDERFAAFTQTFNESPQHIWSGIDTIVSKKHRNKRIGQSFRRRLEAHFKTTRIKYQINEIYKITSINNQPISLPNKGSSRFVQATGSFELGFLPNKFYEVDGLQVEVTPILYCKCY